MNFTRANLTDLGLALNAKIQKGTGKIPLLITRIELGAGTSETPTNQTEVIDPLNFFVPIIRQQAHRNMAEIQIQITNVGNPDRRIPPLAEALTFQQIGFFAIDPEVGEILYRISQLDSAAFIPAAMDFPYTVAPIYIFSTANAETVNITIDPAGLVTIRMLAAHNTDPNAHTNIIEDLRRQIHDLTSTLNQHKLQTATHPNGIHGHRIIGNRIQFHIPPLGWLFLGANGELILPEGEENFGEGGYGEGGFGGGSTNGRFTVTSGLLQNTAPFADVQDGTLVFKENFARVENSGLILTK